MNFIRVNNEEITEQEFIAEINKICSDKGVPGPNKEIVNQALDNLIRGILILGEARRQDIKISNDEVEQELLDYMMQFENQRKYQEGLDDLHVSNDQLKKLMKNKLLIKKYIDDVLPPFEADEQQLYQVYLDNVSSFKIEEAIRVSHILVKPESGIEKAYRIRDMIKTPHDFNKIVGSCSDCPSCLQAGDLGYITKGKMVAEFDEVAFSMQIDQISQPVTTRFGHHIIMLTDRKKEVVLPFEEVKEFMVKRLKQIENDLTIHKLLGELKDKADIQISDKLAEYLR